ncbi:Phosphatidylcholine transfer protein [Acropora cervicornis]|uniref:Phosphatidylcholine transfer protein n=1 Tax=Acropora cervicornis TaxID=6130 RepID=A0AAD9QI74_ACRCE|nr:Phosphatidylcholine transfer protein [Acropora cervicornis]
MARLTDQTIKSSYQGTGVISKRDSPRRYRKSWENYYCNPGIYCVMWMGFAEEKFLEVAQEINNIKLNGYEFFTESVKESVECKIYRKYDTVSGLYEYKIMGSILDVLPNVCKEVYMDLEYRKKWDEYVNGMGDIKEVYMDLEYRKKWDEYVNELYEFDEDGEESIYWNVKYPWPMSNRDYVYRRALRELEINNLPTVVVLAESKLSAKTPERSGVVRVKEYHQSLIIQGDGMVGTKAFIHYFDNPGGMIPVWLINWVAKTGVPDFLSSMREACFGYEDFSKNRH